MSGNALEGTVPEELATFPLQVLYVVFNLLQTELEIVGIYLGIILKVLSLLPSAP